MQSYSVKKVHLIFMKVAFSVHQANHLRYLMLYKTVSNMNLNEANSLLYKFPFKILKLILQERDSRKEKSVIHWSVT